MALQAGAGPGRVRNAVVRQPGAPMDFGRIRRIATAFTLLALACIAVGLLAYLKGSVAIGVTLMIVGVSVGIISMTYLRMLSLVDNPWLVTNKKNKRKKSHHRGAGVFPGASEEAPDRYSVPAPVGGLVLPEAVPAVDGPSLSGLEGDLALLAAVGADCFEVLPGPVVVPVPVTSVCHDYFSLRYTNKSPPLAGPEVTVTP